MTGYNYSGASCNGAFPTSVTVAGMTTQFQYNCIGGVVTSVTDPNNAVISAYYVDPYYWRPFSTTDPMGNITYFTYFLNVDNSGSQAVESVLTAGGNTIVDNLAVVDAFGRPSLNQTHEGTQSSTWDTTEYLYDASGRIAYVTLPFAGSAGAAQGNLIATSYSYDGLNRYVDIEQPTWTNLDIHYTYNLNDVEVTVNPAPSGEKPKSRQYQYDALGD